MEISLTWGHQYSCKVSYLGVGVSWDSLGKTQTIIVLMQTNRCPFLPLTIENNSAYRDRHHHPLTNYIDLSCVMGLRNFQEGVSFTELPSHKHPNYHDDDINKLTAQFFKTSADY